jgi:hypothetical protein
VPHIVLIPECNLPDHCSDRTKISGSPVQVSNKSDIIGKDIIPSIGFFLHAIQTTSRVLALLYVQSNRQEEEVSVLVGYSGSS